MLSRAEYFQDTMSSDIEPQAKRQTWEETAHQIRLSPPGSAECDRRWCCSRSERGGEGATDSDTSAPPGRRSCSRPIRTMLVILVGALQRPGSDSGLDSAKTATVSGALVHRRRCSRRDSTQSVKKGRKKSGFDPSL